MILVRRDWGEYYNSKFHDYRDFKFFHDDDVEGVQAYVDEIKNKNGEISFVKI